MIMNPNTPISVAILNRQPPPSHEFWGLLFNNDFLRYTANLLVEFPANHSLLIIAGIPNCQ